MNEESLEGPRWMLYYNRLESCTIRSSCHVVFIIFTNRSAHPPPLRIPCHSLLCFTCEPAQDPEAAVRQQPQVGCAFR